MVLGAELNRRNPLFRLGQIRVHERVESLGFIPIGVVLDDAMELGHKQVGLVKSGGGEVRMERSV
jgi:hypothetical protein